jgi:hypothetical protein
MGRACNTWERWEVHTFYLENLVGMKNYFDHLDVQGKIILK